MVADDVDGVNEDVDDVEEDFKCEALGDEDLVSVAKGL